MIFLNRRDELERLESVSRSDSGGLVVVYGRRRLGKTRLLLEWARSTDGLYTVADQSAPHVQRRYLAQAVASRLEGFADVEYRDWPTLFERMARDASAARWRGPLILDELPYLVAVAPELPSILQRWLDHEALRARLVVAIAGSSQRMMQGLVLAPDAPLYGRAREIIEVRPLDARYLREVWRDRGAVERTQLYAAWGGVPRYWELSSDTGGDVRSQIDRLVLDPLGPLHREPDRLLLEELPSALETRPVLDAIGAGANRVSEIGARIGRPATSISKPLERLTSMGLVRREIPFGESEKKSRRSLYKIDDPFFSLWFKVVAPNRGALASSPRAIRLELLDRHWSALAGGAWEELCRRRIPNLPGSIAIGRRGPWGPAARWWHGNEPEWDIVSRSLDNARLLLGEVRWNARALGPRALARGLSELAARPAPPLARGFEPDHIVRVLFVPAVTARPSRVRGKGPFVVTAEDVL